MTAADAARAARAEAFAGTEVLEFDFEDGVDENGDPVVYQFAIQPIRKWGSSAHAALRAGDFEAWAQKVLVDGTYESAWQIIDPNLDQVDALIMAWQDAAGESLPKSKPSPPSSRNTKRR